MGDFRAPSDVYIAYLAALDTDERGSVDMRDPPVQLEVGVVTEITVSVEAVETEEAKA